MLLSCLFCLSASANAFYLATRNVPSINKSLRTDLSICSAVCWMAVLDNPESCADNLLRKWMAWCRNVHWTQPLEIVIVFIFSTRISNNRDSFCPSFCAGVNLQASFHMEINDAHTVLDYKREWATDVRRRRAALGLGFRKNYNWRSDWFRLYWGYFWQISFTCVWEYTARYQTFTSTLMFIQSIGVQ